MTTVAVGTFPMGVALDNKARKLYWADNGTDAIYRANYDGSAQETLYRSPNSHANPDGLALDLSHGRMFWSESQAVRSAGLDGSGVADVLTGTPTGVALSPATSTLYWSDNVSDTIHRAAYDGTGAQLVYRTTPTPDQPGRRQLGGVTATASSGWRVPSCARRRAYGSGVRTVATGQSPTDVSVNPVLRKLVPDDNGTDTVNRANYDGSAAETLYANTDPFSNPRGVAVAMRAAPSNRLEAPRRAGRSFPEQPAHLVASGHVARFR